MTKRERFNALNRHEWELQGSAGVWESYYKCGKCGKQAREDSDGPAISADGCTQARAQSPQVPEGMALVPVSKLRDAERYAWLKENCGERLTRRSLLNEFSEHKTEYIFPSLIAWADFCGQITLDEAIDFKIEAAKEPSDD